VENSGPPSGGILDGVRPDPDWGGRGPHRPSLPFRDAEAAPAGTRQQGHPHELRPKPHQKELRQQRELHEAFQSHPGPGPGELQVRQGRDLKAAPGVRRHRWGHQEAHRLAERDRSPLPHRTHSGCHEPQEKEEDLKDRNFLF